MNDELHPVIERINVNIDLPAKIYKWGTGDKPTILLLHGLGSTGYSFAELAVQLGKDFNVMATDLPGHGESLFLRNTGQFSVEWLADWVNSILEYYNLPNVHIAGHSLGGDIGLAFAKKYSPQSLILLDGGYMRAESIAESSLEEELRNAEDHIKNYKFSSWDDYDKTLLDSGLSEKIIALSKSSMREVDGGIKLIVESHVAKEYIRHTFSEPSENTLRDIKAPVLLLRSTIPEALNEVRVREADRLKKFLEAEVVEVNGASHDLYWEKPEFISKQMVNWIQG
ncbi:alpha/beta hydrolase [Halobacillus fulvus]|nr:alpha/beta hydrolase [Halobacillus fulvus]